MHSNKNQATHETPNPRKPSLTAEELYSQLRAGKMPERHKKFLLMALEEEGCKVVKRQKRCVQRNRGKESFKPKDLPKLFSSMDSLTCMMASLVSCVTGSRREETSEILKENIDFDECRIHLVITKKGVPQDVFFPKSFAPLLKKWIHYTRDSRFLFPQRYDSERPISVATLSKNLDKATDKAGLKQAMYVKENGHSISRYGFHSFRKFFCSMLVNTGVPMETARKLMRHEKVELTIRVYAHLGRRNLTEAMNRIDPYAEQNQQHDGQNGHSQIAPNQHSTDTRGIFAGQYIQLFNEFRNGKITEEQYRRQRQELTEIQALMKS